MGSLALSLGVLGCSGSTPTPKTGDRDTTEATGATAEEPGTSTTDEASAADNESSESAEASAEEEPSQGDVGRDVRYHVMPEGLRVTAAGVSFEPKATAIRVGGGWGVRIEVDAKAMDDQAHVLSSPDAGPLAFAASVKRGTKLEDYPDRRQGSGEQFVTPGAPLKFSREWPGTGGPAPLSPGQELTLEVGLWGVGETPTRHRPLMKFFFVKMAVGQKQPTPVISPPAAL